jgi:hypothetical protein
MFNRFSLMERRKQGWRKKGRREEEKRKGKERRRERREVNCTHEKTIKLRLFCCLR